MHVSVRGGCCRLEVTICFWFHHSVPRSPRFRSLQFAENIKRLPPCIYLRISKTTNMFTFDQAFACFAFIHHMHLISHIDLSLHHFEYEFLLYGSNSSQTCVSKLMFAILTFWNFVYKVVCLSLSLSYHLTTQFSRFWCTRRGWCSPWSTFSLGLAELSGEMFYISGDSKFMAL